MSSDRDPTRLPNIVKRPDLWRINSFDEFAKHVNNKARLFRIRWAPMKRRHQSRQGRFFLYERTPNAALLYIGPIEISWRRSWDIRSTWGTAWDGGFRAGYEAGANNARAMIIEKSGGPPAARGLPKTAPAGAVVRARKQ